MAQLFWFALSRTRSRLKLVPIRTVGPALMELSSPVILFLRRPPAANQLFLSAVAGPHIDRECRCKTEQVFGTLEASRRVYDSRRICLSWYPNSYSDISKRDSCNRVWAQLGRQSGNLSRSRPKPSLRRTLNADIFSVALASAFENAGSILRQLCRTIS